VHDADIAAVPRRAFDRVLVPQLDAVDDMFEHQLDRRAGLVVFWCLLAVVAALPPAMGPNGCNKSLVHDAPTTNGRVEVAPSPVLDQLHVALGRSHHAIESVHPPQGNCGGQA
jgi:hypothetical protein